MDYSKQEEQLFQSYFTYVASLPTSINRIQVELLIETPRQHGKGTALLPRRLRSLFTWKGTNESATQPGWKAHTWEGALSRRHLISLTNYYLCPLAPHKQVNRFPSQYFPSLKEERIPLGIEFGTAVFMENFQVLVSISLDLTSLSSDILSQVTLPTCVCGEPTCSGCQCGIGCAFSPGHEQGTESTDPLQALIEAARELVDNLIDSDEAVYEGDDTEEGIVAGQLRPDVRRVLATIHFAKQGA